ncbi:MAG: alpha/beta fold hydrolase [Candidatus Omnitrophota bacterium]|nr:alpha/beta fold hydrolase [Candidatus Omnitrophota bacterium]MDZ4242657.1 alpha/beta fold hydrolase [Candidatus Omnitrophota bacterium]
MKLSGYLVTADRHKVSYDHYQSGHEKVIIIAHGFFNSKQAVLLRRLGESLANEYDVILFDFRGHGRSDGLFSWTAKEYLDLLGIVELASKNYGRIGLIGFSLGAATSIIAASKTMSINSIVSISAPAEFARIDCRLWGFDVKNDFFYNLFGEGKHGKGIRPGPFWHKKEKPLEIVKKAGIPIFYIHGDADWIVRPWHSEELYKNTAAFKRLSIIKNGPHAEHLFREHNEEMLHLIRGWFHETLS